MTEIASRELRNQTRALLDRVAGGERITVTVHGQPVAEMAPIEGRPRWMTRHRFVRDVLAHQADLTLSADLASRAAEATDYLPWR